MERVTLRVLCSSLQAAHAEYKADAEAQQAAAEQKADEAEDALSELEDKMEAEAEVRPRSCRSNGAGLVWVASACGIRELRCDQDAWRCSQLKNQR